jgi:hypothetical protein
VQDEPSVTAVETLVPGRFALLASAIAGQSLDVAAGAPGAPAWTDGRAIFVDPGSDQERMLQCIAVQASLLAAGSLGARVLAKLGRGTSAARRYLSVEGHRALVANLRLLPAAAMLTPDYSVAQRSESPDTSMALALGDEPVPEPPDEFGVIRPRLVRRTEQPARTPVVAQHRPRRERQKMLSGLDDDVIERPAIDVLSSPVGGGGPIGRLFKRFLSDVRSTGGPPGADAPTRWSASGRLASGTATTSSGASITDEGNFGRSRGFVYPEWDVHHGRYRPAWCTVVEAAPDTKDHVPFAVPSSRPLRRALARLGTELERRHRQLQGEDIDIDAAVDALVARVTGATPDEAIYIEAQRRRRDLAVLLLLDVSGSAGERSATGGTVHEHQRSAAAIAAVALHDAGDRVALYAFRSQGRTAVHVIPVKRFDESIDAVTRGPLGGLVPGGFTRLGAAIRHGDRLLEEGAGTGRRLLVVLSDGFAYDHGYEGGYGEADARRALSEARHRGTGCVCLSIGATTAPEVLPRVFGTAAHASIGRVDELAGVVGPLFVAALGTAEIQRRRFMRAVRTTARQRAQGTTE